MISELKKMLKGKKHFSTFALSLFFVLTPFEYPLADIFSVSPLRIVGIISMGFALIDIILQRKIHLSKQIIFIVLWLIYGLFSYFWTIDETRFLSYYSMYLNNALMFLLISMVIFDSKEIKIFKYSIVIGVIGLLLYMKFVPGAVIFSDFQHRLTINTGTKGLDQNYLSGIMLVAFGIMFFDFCNKKRTLFFKILSLSFCIIITLVVLFAGSRSGLISLLVVFVLCINTSWKSRIFIGLPLIIMLICVLPLLLNYLPIELVERFSFDAFLGKKIESGSRLIIWEKAIESMNFLDWIFGCGVGSPQALVGNVLGSGNEMTIHNHYLAMIVEVGLIGSLLINLPVFILIMGIWNKDRKISVSVIGVLVIAFFIDVITTKFFWCAFMLLSVSKNSKNNY